MENNLPLITELLQSAVLVVPLVTGLTEALKRAFNITAQYVPLISIVLGAGAGLLIAGISIPAGVAGVIFGLAGVGLWEFGKTTLFSEKVKPDA